MCAANGDIFLFFSLSIQFAIHLEATKTLHTLLTKFSNATYDFSCRARYFLRKPLIIVAHTTRGLISASQVLGRIKSIHTSHFFIVYPLASYL